MNSINANMATPIITAKSASTAATVSSQSGQTRVTAAAKTLADIAIGEKCVVRKLLAPEGMPEWLTQLEDIGFIAGEPVALMARGAFGGDPLVIRIGLSTFALRKAEAACVVVDFVENKVAA
ncbi:FeoA family protein [Undibacterium sp. Ji22W]|uniref:FeoA family protein n=1 Tax=Undibacterium sp. Ji22W TaxID=3413038 RepID=UPI003BF350CE